MAPQHKPGARAARPCRAQAALACVLLALAGGARAQAAAEAPSAAASAPAALPEIRVKSTAEPETATSPVPGYSARRGATGTKTDTPLIETPQSISVITRDRIDAIGATTVVDALGYTPGVRTNPYGHDSRYDWTVLRGFDAYSPGYYLDGLHARNNGSWFTWRYDPYGAERIEVLRGPASVLYGQSGPGGVINVVSKRPQADTRRELQLQLGSFERRQLAADLGGALDADGRWLYRISALARDSGTQVDFVVDDRVFIQPALTWRPGADTSLTLIAHLQRDRSGSTLGFLPLQGTLLPNPNGRIAVSRLVGEPGFDRFDSDQADLGWLLEHRASDTWTVRQNLRYGRGDLDYTQLFGAGSFRTTNAADPDDPANFRLLERSSFGSREQIASLTLDSQAQATFDTGGVRHTLLIGLDHQRHRFDQRTFFGSTEPLDVYAPVYGQGVVVPAPFADADIVLGQTGLYVQDQMKLGERWVFALGTRRDRTRIDTDNRLDGSASRQRDDKTSSRGGVVYLAPSGLAPYLSWSQSFTPVTTLNPATGRPFSPETGRQLEAGVRWQPPGRALTLAGAAFDLRRRNYITNDASFVPSQVGEVQVRGVELEAALQPVPGSNLTAAWTWLPKAEVSASSNPDEIGRQQAATPEHTLSLWADKRWALGARSGLRLGVGVRHVGATRGDGESAPEQIPALTLLDASLAWDLGNWVLGLNARNLTDKTYVANCGFGTCYYGAVRTVVATATHRY